jgi:hypothetical protein
VTKKKAPKLVRRTKSEQYLVNVKYLGIEPDFDKTKEMPKVKLAMAFNWYNAMCNQNDAREYLKDYLKSQNRNDELKKLNRVSDQQLPLTVAWACRMLMRGAQLDNETRAFVEEKLKDVYGHVDANDVKEAAIPEKNQPSIQQRMKEKSSNIIGDIENLIDSGEDFSLYEWLQKNEIAASYTTAIIRHYVFWLDELLEAYDGTDSQLKEAYKYLTKKQLKERILFFNNLIEDAKRYGSNTKKIRAPRKPKPVSIEKKLKYIKFQKEDQTLKVASINPEKIIGAQELWVVNTKYKTLSVFRALDRGGLQINRTTVTNYCEKTSHTKRIGRKPEEYIDKVLNSGKLVLRKLVDELKDAPLAPRLNENTVLLRTV